jgi:hypothetical protein
VFGSGTELYLNSHVFAFFLIAIRFYTDSSFYFSEVITLWLVMFSWLCFQMNMDDYPHFFLAEDRRLCSMGHHCPGFPRVLYDSLIRPGYNGDVPIYHCRLTKVHGLDVCEVNMMIPFDPMMSWMGTFVGSEPDTTVEQMAHVALTSLCESRIAATTVMPSPLFPNCNEENHMWQQCLEVVSDLEGPHFSTGLVALAKYTQYLSNLQHNTTRTVM